MKPGNRHAAFALNPDGKGGMHGANSCRNIKWLLEDKGEPTRYSLRANEPLFFGKEVFFL